MEIKLLKLNTGEEVISQIKDDVDKEYLWLIKPQKFIMTQEGVASMPMMPLSKDEKFKINKKDVTIICEPEDEIRNLYNSKHGSGVILPSRSGIIEG